MGVGAPTLALSQRFSRRNSISSDSDLGIDIERHCSSRKRLGDLPALLEREVVALEDLAGRLDELRYVIASAQHRFRLVAVIEGASLASAWRFSNRSAFSRERIVSIRICRGSPCSSNSRAAPFFASHSWKGEDSAT